MIVNETRGRAYIGSSINVYKRWTQHKYHLKKGTHHNPQLQNLWNKYKEDTFKWAFIEPVEDINLIYNREQAWIKVYNPTLNIIRNIKANTKRHRREEGKRRQAEFMIGNQYAKGKKKEFTQEVKDRISAKLKGTRHSDESYAQMSRTVTGKKHTKEHKKKMVIAQRSRADRGTRNISVIKNSSNKHSNGEKINTAKLTSVQVIEIRKLYEGGESGTDLGETYNVNNSTIYAIVNRKSWKHIL